MGYGAVADVATEAFGALRDESVAGYSSVDSIANGAFTFAGNAITGLVSQGKSTSPAVGGGGGYEPPNDGPPPPPVIAPPTPTSPVIKLPSLKVLEGGNPKAAIAKVPISLAPLRYYTYKKDVPIGPGQVLKFSAGKGYYAAAA
jgi:hypothetical protein